MISTESLSKYLLKFIFLCNLVHPEALFGGFEFIIVIRLWNNQASRTLAFQPS